MARKIKNNVHWVGKIDWELRRFHGDEYSTHRGTSYNAYLIREEKTVLIDTVWAPFGEEFIGNLEKEVDLTTIDYIIANHAEIDHSGALPLLMEKIPDTPVYCTKRAIDSLTGHYHREWNFHTIETGESLEIGNGKKLIFIEAPMLHWPDSMFTYLTEDNILFSNDAFGQHYASEFLFNDLVDQNELYSEAIKYYANILTPFSSFVTKKIEELIELGVPVDIICPSHGVIWRENPMQIVETYQKWADNYKENQITLFYDTMWNGTKRLTEAIAGGIREADDTVEVKLFNTVKTDKNDMVTEVFKSKAIALGSPTINKGILTSTAAFLEQIKGLNFKNKKAAAYGCYGWSGESPKIMQSALEEAGFTVMKETMKQKWNPDENALKEAASFGREFTRFSVD